MCYSEMLSWKVAAAKIALAFFTKWKWRDWWTMLVKQDLLMCQETLQILHSFFWCFKIQIYLLCISRTIKRSWKGKPLFACLGLETQKNLSVVKTLWKVQDKFSLWLEQRSSAPMCSLKWKAPNTWIYWALDGTISKIYSYIWAFLMQMSAFSFRGLV